MNISGVVVYASPKSEVKVTSKLNSLKGVEVHASENGKLVVTVEDENIRAVADQVMQIQNMKGVMSVAMVYQHDEDDEELNSVDVVVEDNSSCTTNTCNEYTSQEALL